MVAAVKPIPDGYRCAIPYLICKNAASAVDFYQKAFGAQVVLRMDGPNGMVAHAELKIGDALFMLGEECPEMQARSPQAFGGSPVSIYVCVKDVDAFTQRATAAGAKLLKGPADQFYGDRSAALQDPFGHMWGFATHIEDVPPDELRRRSAEKFAAAAK